MEGAKRDDASLVPDGPHAGIIARAVSRIFTALEASGAESHVKISFLEIYNERLDDLLAQESSLGGGGGKPSAGGAAASGSAGDDGKERLKIVEASTDPKAKGLVKVRGGRDGAAWPGFAQGGCGVAAHPQRQPATL